MSHALKSPALPPQNSPVTWARRMSAGTLLFALSVMSVNSHAQFRSEDFTPVMSCDDGAVIVDVDLNDPRRAQIVVHNYEVTDYLVSLGILRDRNASFITPSGPSPYEFILQGYQDQRLTDVGFLGIEGFSPNLRIALETRTGPFARHGYRAFVYPEAGGLKIRIDEEISAFSGCTVYPTLTSSGSECIGGEYVSFPAEYFEDRANWFFPNCVNL